MLYNYFTKHPLRVARSQRDVPLGNLIAQLPPLTGDHLCPLNGAFIHYGGVELADKLAILQPSATPQELNDLQSMWNETCGHYARVLLFYVFRIIHKELRHGNLNMTVKAFGEDWGSDPYFKYAGGATSGNWQKHMEDESHADLKLGPLVDAIEQHYRKGGWGGSFGGKRWADIALQFKKYIDGEMSALVCADRCWTLVHNTGPIFNKGFYFKNNNPIKILNAQASSSVFTLSGLGDATFDKFRTLATTIIQRAEPDYGITYDKAAIKASSKNPYPVNTKTIGPISISTYKEENEHV